MSEWRSFVSILKATKAIFWSSRSPFANGFGGPDGSHRSRHGAGCFFIHAAYGQNQQRFGHYRRPAGQKEDRDDPDATERLPVPKGVEVYEVNGPLFFAAAHNFKETLTRTNRRPKYLIIRMRHVPIVDATGVHNLWEVLKEFKAQGTQIVLSGEPNVFNSLERGIVEWLGSQRMFRYPQGTEAGE